MKKYLKKDYWFYKDGNKYIIIYRSKFEKYIKTIIHFLLKKKPIIYIEGLNQKAYKPIIRINKG